MAKFQEAARVVAQEVLAPMLRKLVLYAPKIASSAQAGQFIHLAAGPNQLLRRPLSIADIDLNKKTITVIYKIIGKGTGNLAAKTADDAIDCLGPLGRPFTVQGVKPLLVGGGIGIAPLLLLAKSLCPRPSEVLMGGRSAEDMIWPPLFAEMCQQVHVTTDDGSAGIQGFTVDLLPALLQEKSFDMIYTCGPKVMMEGIAAIAKQAGVLCQVLLEEYMACGVGACLSCTCATSNGGRAKICTDGPVFWSSEVFDL